MATTVERSAEMTDEEKQIMREGNEATRKLVKAIGVPGQMVKIDDLPADNNERVPMMVKRPFNLTLRGHRQIHIPAGIRSIPVTHNGEEIADHPYLLQHGVERYEVTGASPRAPLPGPRAAPVSQTLVLLASKDSPAFVKIGETETPVSVYVTKAFESSGLSADEWNRLDDGMRHDMIGEQVMVATRTRARIEDFRKFEADRKAAEEKAAQEQRTEPQLNPTVLGDHPNASGQQTGGPDQTDGISAEQAEANRRAEAKRAARQRLEDAQRDADALEGGNNS